MDKDKSNLPIEKLPATVVIDDYKVTIDEKGNVTIEGESTGGNGGGEENPTPPTPPVEETPTLPSTVNTTPFLPEGAEQVEGTNLETGLVIKDSNENEWVWVEVPKSIYENTTYNGGTAPTSSEDYEKIENVMQAYANDYRQSGYTDTFYSTEQHGFANETEYNNHKNSMLKSVYENGGFYIGRYETGSETARFSVVDTLTTPIIQRDAYPYNFVTCRQAQDQAKQLATGGKTSSLMFGIQWDLVMKYIEEKGAKTQAELKTDSSTWGNYNGVTFNVNRGEYTTSLITSGSWNDASSYTKPTLMNVVFTTGASDRNSVLGIYDLAGNLTEWTLENNTLSTTHMCAFRGTPYNSKGSPASNHFSQTVNGNGNGTIGSRVALW